MTAPEVPLEQTQEELIHRAEAADERWIMYVALTAAILAVLAAVASLMAEHHAAHVMIEQILSADKWSQYQAKSVKANLLKSKIELLDALGKSTAQKDVDKLAEYEKEQEEIKAEAEAKQVESEHHLHAHAVYSRGVTMFQIGIAVGAISVLTRRRRFWLGSLLFGGAGAVFFLFALVTG